MALSSSESRKVHALKIATMTKSSICPSPTSPIPIVLPRMMLRGLVEVTKVSIILEVFSTVIELET